MLALFSAGVPSIKLLKGLASRRAPRLEEPWRSAFTESLVSPLNLYFLHELIERLGRLDIEGDIVECGVYRGGSAAVLGWSMMRLDGDSRKLWLFDSFAGMPVASDRDGAYSRTLEGAYVGSEERTRQLLQRVGLPPHRYRILKGLFADTFPQVETPRTALLHIDCDFFDPVRLTLEKFMPSVTPGGFLVLNDYGIYKGARDAADGYLRDHGVEVEPVAIDPTAAFFQMPGSGFSGLPVAGHYPGWPGAVA
jgi:O-methyltransferase